LLSTFRTICRSRLQTVKQSSGSLSTFRTICRSRLQTVKQSSGLEVYRRFGHFSPVLRLSSSPLDWQFVTDVSGPAVGPIFIGLSCPLNWKFVIDVSGQAVNRQSTLRKIAEDSRSRLPRDGSPKPNARKWSNVWLRTHTNVIRNVTVYIHW